MIVNLKITGSEDVRRMLLRIGQQASARALAATAEDVEDYVDTQVQPHNKTGATRRSLTKRRVGNAWEVFHDLQVAPQALWVHWGTKPHVIRPRRKKALRWPTGSGFAGPFGAVKHPGYAGDPWMVRAAAQAPLIFRRHVEAYVASLNTAKG